MPNQATKNWKITGAAGEGIKTTGLMFSKACLRQHLATFDYTEYPSLIRGGHNTYQVTFSPTFVSSPEISLDYHIALNSDGLNLHLNEFQAHTHVLFDPEDTQLEWKSLKCLGIPLIFPMANLARQLGLDRVMINNLSLGASIYHFGLSLQVLDQVIADTFGHKNTSIIELNQKAAHAGYEYALHHFSSFQQPLLSMPSKSSPNTYAMTGNEALSLGLIAGGLQAYIAYPMTPASSILHLLAAWQPQGNFLVKHAEDEIGVINMALGTSFAGVKTAVGTSGGGFCYMTEALGMAGVAELPLVIIEAQRPGPALGMPTWTAQGDLLFSIFASQDEFPRIVLAPGDVAEAFSLARLSLDLADRFQLPVIILSDKHLSESAQSFSLPETNFSNPPVSHESQPQIDQNGFFPRYQLSQSGVSPRTLPGTPNGFYIANSYEHDRFGLGSETAPDRTSQMDKRFSKLGAVMEAMPPLLFQNKPEAKATLIGWGSTKGSIMAAAALLESQQLPCSILHLSWLWPFPAAQIKSILDHSPTPILLEGNSQFQLAKLIRQETGFDLYHKRAKYDGRPFFPEDIVTQVKAILNQD